jgi:L-rhamnose isomerase
LKDEAIESAFEAACEIYAKLGVDVWEALKKLDGVSLSLHCWQGDDVAGFEAPDAELSGGGIQVTGNHPGKARNVDELRADMEQAFALLPGNHRANLHAMYGEFGGKRVDRNAIEKEHYKGWVDWARGLGLGVDFNATCFSHPLAAAGYTLSSPDSRIREFWVEHSKRCRSIGAWIGEQIGKPCVHNLWIPDGCKDNPVDRLGYRRHLDASLAAVFADDYPASRLKDSVECKLFGIGSEAYVVGSHEFYLAWAIKHGKMICLDMGHFHPTESVADKISALLPFFPELLLHVSRGVRWDSDHVVVFGDELRALMQEVVRADALGRVHFALDYFDGSMNRVGAWVTGARAALKALLAALLEPIGKLRSCEAEGLLFERLALLEEAKTLPVGAVWDYHCLQHDVPAGTAWIADVAAYERRVQSVRL